MKKISRKVKRYRRETLRIASQHITTNNIDAVAVVLLELNCGCMKVAGASANGDQVGPMIMIPGLPPKKNRVPICLKCMEDDGSPNRVIRRGIMWEKDNGKKLNEINKNVICQKAFGCNAPELDLEHI
jgi:hypothetical protein